MKLPRYTATTPPPRTSGAVRASDIGALTRSSEQAKWSGVGAFGRGIDFAGRLAFQAHQYRQAADDEIEGGIFTQKAQELFNLGDKEAAAYDFTNNMPQLGDKDYYTTVENYSTDIRDKATNNTIDGTTKKLNELISSIKSPRVKADAEVWLSKNIEQKSDVIRHTYAVGHENWQITQMTKMMETLAKNGDIENADRLARKMDEFNLITPQRVEVLKKNNKIIADTSITYREAHAKLVLEGRQSAIDFIMAQPIDVEIQKDVVSKINFIAAQQQDRLEIAREKDRDEISKLIRSGQSATDRIENSYLDETEQWTWFERERSESDRRAKGTEIATNQQIKGQLESMAYNIPTGAIKMPELMKRLYDERYTKKTIDDDAYDEIFSLAQRKFKIYQAGAMEDRENYALGQLVDLPSEESLRDKLARTASQFEKEQITSLRKLQFDNLDRYKKALRDWLKTKPDADADEIYIAGRSLLKHYRKSPDQLRNKPLKRDLRLEGQLPPDFDARMFDRLGTVNTMEKPANLKVFEERMARLPTRDARNRYYQKWYKIVKGK